MLWPTKAISWSAPTAAARDSGREFKKLTYGRLGALETEDQISTARHGASQPWVDPARIGIYGWSYGGFMALSCAMKGHGLFRMAIAVARGTRGAITTRSTPKFTTTSRSTTPRVTTTIRRSTSRGCSTTSGRAC